MASRFCQSFIFGVFLVALVLTSGKWKKELKMMMLFFMFMLFENNKNP